MKKTTKKKTATKTNKSARWVMKSECEKLRKLQQQHCGYLTKLIENPNIEFEAKKILKAMRKDVMSSVQRSIFITIRY